MWKLLTAMLVFVVITTTTYAQKNTQIYVKGVEYPEQFKYANRIIYHYPGESASFYTQVKNDLKSNGFTIDSIKTSDTLITTGYKKDWSSMGIVQKYRLKIEFDMNPKRIIIMGDAFNTNRGLLACEWEIECLGAKVNKYIWDDIHMGFMSSFEKDSVT